jgi:NitT/TauT family transport system ATP-binding protein
MRNRLELIHGGGSSAIVLRGLEHTYRARAGVTRALKPLSLSIESGESVALVGPSGCGKSTLLRIVAGLLEPTSGDVHLFGQKPEALRQERGIGWMAQEGGLLPWRTVDRNVSLPFEIGRHHKVDQRAIDDVLHLVGLTDARGRYPHELSGGMRQRAALARALVTRPRLLLLDEPFAHLDEITRERLGDLVVDIWANLRPTLIMVTHSVHEAVRVADRVIVMSGSPGQIVDDFRVALPRPRTEDQPTFGPLVAHLKQTLLGNHESADEEAPVREPVRV